MCFCELLRKKKKNHTFVQPKYWIWQVVIKKKKTYSLALEKLKLNQKIWMVWPWQLLLQIDAVRSQGNRLSERVMNLKILQNKEKYEKPKNTSSWYQPPNYITNMLNLQIIIITVLKKYELVHGTNNYYPKKDQKHVYHHSTGLLNPFMFYCFNLRFPTTISSNWFCYDPSNSGLTRAIIVAQECMSS